MPTEALAKTTLAQITPKARMDSLRSMLEAARSSMALVVPRHVTPERLIKLALVAASRTPLLLQCDPKSIVQGVMTAAQLGLDCGGVLGSAYLVPFKNAKNGGRYEAQLIVGYRGLVDLARRSGEIDTIEAHVVHANDAFEIAFGLDPVLRHVPCLKDEPGEMVLVYAIARLKDGGRQVEVMTRAQVDRIRQRSRAGQSGPWVSDYDEMARKTVVRRLCKYLPLSPELADALAVDEKVEGSAVVDLVPVETHGEDAIEADVVPQQTEKAASLTERLRGTSAPDQDREPGSDDEA
jgi:recombination protein RecT